VNVLPPTPSLLCVTARATSSSCFPPAPPARHFSNTTVQLHVVLVVVAPTPSRSPAHRDWHHWQCQWHHSARSCQRHVTGGFRQCQCHQAVPTGSAQPASGAATRPTPEAVPVAAAASKSAHRDWPLRPHWHWQPASHGRAKATRPAAPAAGRPRRPRGPRPAGPRRSCRLRLQVLTVVLSSSHRSGPALCRSTASGVTTSSNATALASRRIHEVLQVTELYFMILLET